MSQLNQLKEGAILRSNKLNATISLEWVGDDPVTFKCVGADARARKLAGAERQAQDMLFRADDWQIVNEID